MPKPNVPALKMLAARMSGLPSHAASGDPDGPAVYMCAWIEHDHQRPGCGTVGCIAGHAVALADGHEAASRLAAEGGVSDIPRRAQAVLGLHDPEANFQGNYSGRLDRVAHALFYPPGARSEEPRIREILDAIDGDDCARVLLHIADNPDTVTADSVRLLWQDVEDIRRDALYG
ncbi:MAG: hypothetical protein OXK74_02170 [Gemmatimonadota bacterium]|nr:hypothetical protein [Gemmatimonadota bacterium]